jgi:hypothetical protein
VARDIQQLGLSSADIRGLVANLFLVSGVLDNQTIIDDVNLYKRCIYDESWRNQAINYVNINVNYSKYVFTHSELQVLSLARRYGVFKQMYGWIEVIKKLHEMNIKPIESDQEMIDKNYFYSLDVAQLVLQEQTEIFMNHQQTLLDKEQKLHNSIIIQKQNDKKAESLKKQSLFKAAQVKKALKTKILKNDNYVAPHDDEDKNNGPGGTDGLGDIIRNSSSGESNKNLASYDDLAEDSSMLL